MERTTTTQEDKALDTAPGENKERTELTEAVGAITGASAGAGVGVLLGPVGILVGAAAGALGGWWAGHAVGDVLGDFTEQDDGHYRRIHEESELRTGRTYDEVRDLYRFGHLAGRNPDYKGRAFRDVELDLKRAWQHDTQDTYGAWEDARDYVARGYEARPR